MESQSRWEHLSEEMLEAYALGQAAEAECVQLEEHLLACEHCQDRLDEVETYLQAARTAAAELRRKAKESRSRRPERRLWPVAATAFAALSLVLFVPWRAGHLRSVREVDLAVQRGAGPRAVIQAPAGQSVALNLDLTELQHVPEYRVELVNSSGSPIWAGLVKSEGNHLRAALPFQLPAGVYWVRLYIPAPTPLLLREYGLQAS